MGPIGVLCIRRTLAHGRSIGLISGLGAASADAVYGFIAAFGLTFLTNTLINNITPLAITGGAFLVYLGFRTMRARPPVGDLNATPLDAPSALGAYLSTFALTITNPATILAFVAIFAGLGLADRITGYDAALVTVLGVFTGSALWWLTLSTGVSVVRRFVRPSFMLWINRGSGGVLIAFGLLAMASAFR